MINLKSVIQTTLCALIVSFSLATSAQTSNQPQPEYFIEIKSITVDSYVALHNTLKTDGTFEISSACIPAHILKIRIKNGSQEAAAFKQNFELLSQTAGINDVTVLSDYNEEKFIDRCAVARAAGQ